MSKNQLRNLNLGLLDRSALPPSLVLFSTNAVGRNEITSVAIGAKPFAFALDWLVLKGIFLRASLGATHFGVPKKLRV
jgi:hypothetical protein